MDYQKKVPFEESHLYKKCHNMLFVIYLLQTGQLRIESEIKYLRLYEMCIRDRVITSVLCCVVFREQRSSVDSVCASQVL